MSTRCLAMLVELMLAGNLCWAAQDLDAAKREAMSHYNDGISAAKKGDKKQAEENYRQAIKLDPQYADAYNNLGVLLDERGARKEAEKYYKDAIKHDRKLVAAFLNLAQLLYDQKRFAESEEATTRAIALLTESARKAEKPELSTVTASTRLADAYVLLGLSRVGMNQHEEAIEAFRKQLELGPDRAMTHHYLGLSLVQKGDSNGAIREWREAVSLDPNLAEAHFNLGALLYRAGQNAEATLAFKDFLRLRPEAPNRSQIEQALKHMAEPQ